MKTFLNPQRLPLIELGSNFNLNRSMAIFTTLPNASEKPMSNPNSGRVIIENVTPDVDGGRFPIVRKLGDRIKIEADLFADGHDILAAELIVTNPSKVSRIHGFISLGPGLDRFVAELGVLNQIGMWQFKIHAWMDSFQTWIHEIEKKFEAGVSIKLELLEGQILIHDAKVSAHEAGDVAGSEVLGAYEIQLTDESSSLEKRLQLVKEKKLHEMMSRYGPRGQVSTLDSARLLRVDRERSVFGAWYEMFPRSSAFEYGRHGDFQDVIRRLPEIADMGFDVLYLPPIHPIGTQFRKGPNNSLVAGPDDPGSPWAIGSEAGGHTAIHAQLGTLDDFHQLVDACSKCDMEIALDIAFQCSPDHPWLKEHPEWFTIRPDGSIRYAENPPKKYQDIHPLNFECKDWQGLWNALRDIFIYWIKQGVKIFRVDNPHTKPFPFWEWCLEEIGRDHPDVIFLAEAFTRPKLMKRLAKAGFTQSYTYFTWRNDKLGLTEYFTELTQSSCNEYLRPNLFANTPDILHQFLQHGGPVAFRIRLILAATLGATYGIYGPPFELYENKPVKPNSEEYLNSEKYEIRTWDRNRPGNLKPLITRINHIRKLNTAMHSNELLKFHEVDNPSIIAYSKVTPHRSNRILTVVNLDPHQTQIGFVDVQMSHFDLSIDREYFAHDLITGDVYTWRGGKAYIELSPERTAHVFRIES